MRAGGGGGAWQGSRAAGWGAAHTPHQLLRHAPTRTWSSHVAAVSRSRSSACQGRAGITGMQSAGAGCERPVVRPCCGGCADLQNPSQAVDIHATSTLAAWKEMALVAAFLHDLPDVDIAISRWAGWWAGGEQYGRLGEQYGRPWCSHAGRACAREGRQAGVCHSGGRQVTDPGFSGLLAVLATAWPA